MPHLSVTCSALVLAALLVPASGVAQAEDVSTWEPPCSTPDSSPASEAPDPDSTSDSAPVSITEQASPATGPAFDADFTGSAMRLDYYHSGIAGEEHVSPDRVRIEGAWPGSRTHLEDTLGLGKYRFRVEDAADGRLLYSQGFSSIYGEWETTGEAKSGVWRTFHESLRFPEPRRPARVILEKRAEGESFRSIFQARLGPDCRVIDRSPVPAVGKVVEVFENGPAAEKVDLLFLGDGYTAAEEEKFRADLTRLTGYLFDSEPFASYRGRFNVRGLFVPSPESSGSGITNPRAVDPPGGIWRATPFGLSYNAFDSDRYVLTEANRRLRELAAQAPYDALVLMANSRKYGGGGIYNLWTTTAADSAEAAYLLVHEFGHSFAGLADEYYTSQVAYEDFHGSAEPSEPNATLNTDPTTLKWKEFITEGTPVPTPWNQDAYDAAVLAYQEKRTALREAGASEEELEALFKEVRRVTGPMLEAEEHYGEVGAFEGASYQAKGLYRPALDCIMFSRNTDAFCPVCSHAIERVIESYGD